VKLKTYRCKQIEVLACLITNRQISVTNQIVRESRSWNSSCTIMFKTAMYCYGSSSMWLSPYHWYIAIWQISKS